MKKPVLFALLLAAAFVTPLFPHAGEVHSYMGTIVTAGEGSYTMKTTSGEEVSFVTGKNTTFRFADNRPAKESDLVPGARAVVEISSDGKTASSIKIARK